MLPTREVVLAALVAAAGAVVYVLLPEPFARALVYDLASLAVVLVVARKARWSTGARRQWWLATAVGFALLAVGNVWWDVALLRQADPAGGPADWTFVVGYALTAVGLSGVAASNLRAGWTDLGLEAVAAGALLGALVWVGANGSSVGGWGEVVAVVLVVFSTIRTLALVRVAAVYRNSWRLLVASLGLVVWLGADVVYAAAATSITYKAGSWLDAVWLGATVLLVVGLAGRRLPCDGAHGPPGGRSMVLGRRVALFLTATLGPMLVLLGDLADSRERVVLAASAALVGLAVVVRVELLNTRHERVREQRDEVTARYEQLFEGTSSPMLLVDHQAAGRIVDANPAAADLYGYDRATLRTMSIGQINTLSAAQVAAEMTRARQAPRTPFEFRHRLASGRVIPVDVYSGPIPFGGHEVLFSIVHDASARHLALAQAREGQARWQQLAELAQDMVYRATYLDGRLVSLDYVNPAGHAVLGVAAATLVEQPSLVVQHLHPADRGRFLELDEQQTGSTGATFRWRRPDGREVWLEDRRTRAEDEDGVTTVVGVVRDVTTQQHTEQALRSALRQQEDAAEELRRVALMKTTFLQATSHELRTPLTSLVGFIETLQEHGDALTPEQHQLLLARAGSNAHRLQRLIEDLLALHQIHEAISHPSREETDLRALLEASVTDLDLREHPVHLDAERTVIVGDPILLSRAIESLLDNAVRHTPAGTPIRVRVSCDGDDGTRPQVIVEDEGQGLPADIVDHDFRPFTQGPQALADPNPGLGIGLALAARIAELHGGTLIAQNRPDGGARLALTLRGSTRTPAGAGGEALDEAAGRRRTRDDRRSTRAKLPARSGDARH